MIHSPTLPIDALAEEFSQALAQGPVVITSPTGSGKSTQVPRWCPGRRVLIVEPRRVACRGLAQRVAELEGSALGEEVGYWVRDERRATNATRLLFVTPGIALRIFERWSDYDTVVVDELHERTLEMDLILALLDARHAGGRVVMSATLDGRRVADWLGGRLLAAPGRTFPVEIRHRPGGLLRPSADGLDQRVAEAVAASRQDPGDVLVFLPGKGEIAACARRLAGLEGHRILELHGGLSLAEQSRAFQPSGERKVVLSTNVAETSVTLPGIGVVIDSGLVRQTRYFRERGYLALLPVARDSAEQRAGRAGRTAPGICYRLWDPAAVLETSTPPEMHRESLVPLVLGAAACGARLDELRFLDPPKEHAVEAATEELRLLGALDETGRIRSRGRDLFGLPLDVHLGRLLIEAEARRETEPGLLEDVVDLVSVLAVDRPLFRQAPRLDEGAAEIGPAAHCDAWWSIRALREAPAGGSAPAEEEDESPWRRNPPQPFALGEARRLARRLRGSYGLSPQALSDGTLDRRRLAMAVLAADPRAAHVARRRGRRVAWSNGGTELSLARESAAQGDESLEAVAVLASRAFGRGAETRLVATQVLPLESRWLLDAGLGRDRLREVRLEKGRPVALIQRIYARRVLAEREETPRGALARQALVGLLRERRLFGEAVAASEERLAAARLAWRLGQRPAGSSGLLDWRAEIATFYPAGPPELEAWLEERVEDLGVEEGEDFELLSSDDFLAPDLPALLRSELDKSFPRRLTMPAAEYEIDYDLGRRRVTLTQLGKKRVEPPSLGFLPRFEGFAIQVRHREAVWILRQRG